LTEGQREAYPLSLWCQFPARSPIMDAESLKKQVNDLLWEGKPQEARALIARENESIQAGIEAAEKHLQELEAKKRVILDIGPPGIAAQQSPEQRPRMSSEQIAAVFKSAESDIDKDARNLRVLEVARDLASKREDRRVVVAVLAAKLRELGIDMGVADNRVNTALSNILIKSGGYTKLNKGLFEAPESKKSDVSTTSDLYSSTASERAH